MKISILLQCNLSTVKIISKKRFLQNGFIIDVVQDPKYGSANVTLILTVPNQHLPVQSQQ